MKLDVLNNAKCVNDYFDVTEVQHDEHYQIRFIAFAFDGVEAFDLVSTTDLYEAFKNSSEL